MTIGSIGYYSNTYKALSNRKKSLRTLISITTNGGAQVSTSIKKYGTGSLALNGTNSYITIGGNNSLDCAGDFTLEFYVYSTATGNNTVWTDSAKTIQWSGGAFVLYDVSNKSFGTLSLNQWYHIAISRSGSTIKGFVDGVQAFSFTSIVTYSFNGRSFGYRALTPAGNYFAGYLDEIRISSNARYTTNFTPSTMTNDSTTLFLCHADGTNGQTTFTDDNS